MVAHTLDINKQMIDLRLTLFLQNKQKQKKNKIEQGRAKPEGGQEILCVMED